MPIHYSIRPLHTVTDADIYTACVRRLDPVEMQDLVDHIVAHGSTVGRADILSVLDDYHSTIADLLMLGMSIVTPTTCYRPGIAGTFTGLGDSFDPARHRLVVRLRGGALLKSKVGNEGRLTKESTEKPRPAPAECLDLASDTTNDVLTPGEGMHLIGRRLRFDRADPDQGVFFVAADGTRTRAERLLEVRPSKAILLVPALPAGAYKVEVRAAFGSGGEIRSGVLDTPLTVS